MDRKPRTFPASLPRFSSRPLGIASTPITARLVPAATDDALRLLLDDGEADARAAASVAYLDGSQPPPLPSRRRPRFSSLSELKNSGATSLAPSPKPTGATAAAVAAAAAAEATEVAATAVVTAESPVHRAYTVERRERESGVDEGLRWRLWHKGEVKHRLARAGGWRAGGGGSWNEKLLIPVERTLAGPVSVCCSLQEFRKDTYGRRQAVVSELS